MKPKLMGKFLHFILPNDVLGITLCPFGIFYRDQEAMNNIISVNHESIHWQQQLEMLIIFFYLWYLIEWGIRFFTNTNNAYFCISFEQEAYDNEKNLNYLSKRKHYAWLKYLGKNIWK